MAYMNMAETVDFYKGNIQACLIRWKVKNIFSLKKLESENFNCCGSSWHLKLVKLRGQEKCIRMYLNRMDSNGSILNKIRTTVTILGKGEQLLQRRDNWSPGSCVWESDIKVIREKEDILLMDGVLTLEIWLIFYKDENEADVNSVEQASINTETDTNMETLTLDFRHLLEDGTHSDITLKCGDTTMPAHTCILSARSKVFASMMRSDMVERRSRVIEISDMDSRILHQLLQFIYSGKLSDLSVGTAPQLYDAADKYDIESLKRQCSAFMQKNLTEENACGVLTLADAHSDRDLKESAIAFILKTQLMKNEDIWLNFCDDHPKLAIEVLNRGYKSDCLK